MSKDHIHKSHNKSLLLYHLVCPVKYRKKVLTKSVAKTIKEVCVGIGERYEIHFVEIGIDVDHVHFLIQSIPSYAPTEIVKKVKSILARQILETHPEVKQQLWGGKFWTTGYYINTVGQYANADVIQKYIQTQGLEDYEQIHYGQLALFEGF